VIRDILLTASVVLAAAIVLGIGIGLGRYSRRDEIDALDYRIGQHEDTIGARIADVATAERTLARVTEDLARERSVTTELRAQLGERRIGATPIWAQLRVTEPPPIPKEWLKWEGSEAGHTGQWRIPDNIAGHVELFDVRTRPARPVDTSLSDTGTFTIAEQADALDAAIDRWTDNVRHGLTPNGHVDVSSRWVALDAAGWVPGTDGTGLPGSPGYPAPSEVIELGEDAVVTQAAPVRRGGSLVPVKDYPAKPQRHGHGKRGKR
jgi:hypothetical protein